MIHTFFMICRTPRSRSSITEPRQRYDTLTAAVDAALTLANQTGEQFTILQAVRTIAPRAADYAVPLFPDHKE